MKVALIVLAVVIVTGVFVALIFRRLHKPRPGFKELVGSRKAKEAYFAMTEPRDDLDRLTERQIDKLVMKFVQSAGQSEEYWQVSHLSERAVPSLLKVLADPRNQVRPSGEDAGWFAKSGVERALEILRRYELPEIAPFLERLASHDDAHLRYAAAVSLATFPVSSNLPAISKLMNDREEHVRTGVFIGLMHAIRANRLKPEVRRSLVSQLAAVIGQATTSTILEAHPAALLLDLDLHAATALLTTTKVLTTTNPEASQILDLLSQRGIAIPDDLLNTLLTATDGPNMDYGSASLRGELLKAMAGMGHPDAESLILHTLARNAPPEDGQTTGKNLMSLKELAAEALCIVRGIRNPIDRAYQREDDASKGGKPMQEPALNVLVVRELDSEIGNGGFDQYFFNSSGSRAARAGLALQAIGALQHAEIARAAVALFGPEGPSAQREQRFRQRENMGAAQVAEMGALEKAWYAAEANLSLLLHTYSAAHAQVFK